MAKFVYRLQALLDQRIAEKDRAQQAVAEAVRTLEEANKTLEELRNKERALIDNKAERRKDMFRAPGDEGLSSVELRERVAYLKRLDKEIEDAGAEVFGQRIVIDECTEAVETARRALADAVREAEALEKHKAQLAERFAAEQARKEELELDEAGTMAYLKRLKDHAD